MESVEEAGALLGWVPRLPGYTAGNRCRAMYVHVRDYTFRELTPNERSFEAHFGDFVVSQSRPGSAAASRLAMKVPYGPQARDETVGGNPGRVYELGPEPDPETSEERQPALVVWAEDDAFHLVASAIKPADQLLPIAESIRGG